MAEKPESDYSQFDRPALLSVLFHPRPDMTGGMPLPGAEEMMIPVAEGVRVHARFHPGKKEGPTLLFFHGNGEIVSDYDDLAPLFGRMGINFLATDYRGYGRSEGTPTVTAMMKDCHTVLAFTRDWLKGEGYGGPLIVMGRSIGSASAIELAASGERSTGLLGDAELAGLSVHATVDRDPALQRVLGRVVDQGADAPYFLPRCHDGGSAAVPGRRRRRRPAAPCRARAAP